MPAATVALLKRSMRMKLPVPGSAGMDQGYLAVQLQTDHSDFVEDQCRHLVLFQGVDVYRVLYASDPSGVTAVAVLTR
jgi:hypothetical protein